MYISEKSWNREFEWVPTTWLSTVFDFRFFKGSKNISFLDFGENWRGVFGNTVHFRKQKDQFFLNFQETGRGVLTNSVHFRENRRIETISAESMTKPNFQFSFFKEKRLVHFTVCLELKRKPFRKWQCFSLKKWWTLKTNIDFKNISAFYFKKWCTLKTAIHLYFLLPVRSNITHSLVFTDRRFDDFLDLCLKIFIKIHERRAAGVGYS